MIKKYMARRTCNEIEKIYGKKNMQRDKKKYMARRTCNEIKKIYGKKNMQ